MRFGLTDIMNKPTKLITISILHLFLLGCDVNKGYDDLAGNVLSLAGLKPNSIKEENMEHVAANPDYPFVATAISMHDGNYYSLGNRDPIMYPRKLRSCIKWGKSNMRMVDYNFVNNTQVWHGEGFSMEEAKAAAVLECNSLNSTHWCMAVVLNGNDICDQEAPAIVAAADAAIERDKRKLEAQRQQEQIRLNQLAENQRKATCDSFGFERETSEHRTCQYELYKLELGAAQNETLRQTIQSANNRQAAIQEQILQEQKFQSGMRLLQQSAEILNPSTPAVKCKFNAIMNTVTCR